MFILGLRWNKKVSAFPQNLGFIAQGAVANPPNTFPSSSEIMRIVGPCLVIAPANLEKLSPWVSVLNRGLHTCRSSWGRLLLRKTASRSETLVLVSLGILGTKDRLGILTWKHELSTFARIDSMIGVLSISDSTWSSATGTFSGSFEKVIFLKYQSRNSAQFDSLLWPCDRFFS